MSDSEILERRKFLVGAAGAAFIYGATRNVEASPLSARYVTVGVDGDYASLVDALAAIESLASASSPYVIKLLPGRHVLSGGEIVLPSWLALDGCGQQISTIEMADDSTYLSVMSNSKISNLSFVANRTSASAAKGILIAKRERVLDFYLEDVTFFLTGGYQAAIEQRWYNHVWYWNNVNIYTTSIGLIARGYQYARNLNIFISGDGTGTPYYGIYVPGMCRFYGWNLRCGTGYGETSVPGFGSKLEIRNDPTVDVVGIYVPATNTNNPRLQIRDMESYCRNELVTDPAYKLNCVRMEAGIARLFGCLTQAEAPSNESVAKDLFTTSTGTIEVYGSRFTKVDGNLSSRNQQAIAYKDVTNDGELLTVGASSQHAASVFLCDASGGAFTLVIPGDWLGGQPPGMTWTFVKTDESPNTVTISAGTGGNISGAPEIVLSTPYDRVTIVHGGVNSKRWFIV